MIGRSLVVTVAVVGVVNAIVLIGVARNRSGTLEAQVVLDERELELLPVESENSGLQLRLRYQNSRFEEERRSAAFEDALAPRFIDQARLTALGFDCSVAAGNDRAHSFYRSALPRPAFVALEIAGPEWERQVAAWQEQRRQQIEEQIAHGGLSGEAVGRARAEVVEAPHRLSRLVPVDVARDGAALRAAYADRTHTMILRGVVALHHVDASDPGGPSLHGHVVQVFPSLLTVPRDSRAPLDALHESPPTRQRAQVSGRTRFMLDHAPRYEVRVSVGRAWQPWISGIRSLRGES